MPPCAHRMITVSPLMILLSSTKSCFTIFQEQLVSSAIWSNCIPSTSPLQHTEEGLNPN